MDNQSERASKFDKATYVRRKCPGASCRPGVAQCGMEEAGGKLKMSPRPHFWLFWDIDAGKGTYNA